MATEINQQLPTQEKHEEDVHENNNSFNSAEIIAHTVSSYGWPILLTAVCIFLVWKKKIQHKFLQWQERRNQDEESARMHRDPELFETARHALSLSRSKLQAQMDEAAQRHKEIVKEKEEAKRLAKLAEWSKSEKGRTTGYSSTVQNNKPESRNNQTQKKPNSGRLRGDYNPLMGSSSSSSGYRPSRGGGAGGG